MQRNKRPGENGRRGREKQNKEEVKRSKMRGGGESVCGADERDGLVIVARQAREADVIFGISGRNFRAVPETRSALATSRVVCCCTRSSLTAFRVYNTPFIRRVSAGYLVGSSNHYMPTPSSSDFHVGMASCPDRVCVKFVGGNRRVAHLGCGCPRLGARRNALWTTLDKLDSRPLKEKNFWSLVTAHRRKRELL